MSETASTRLPLLIVENQAYEVAHRIRGCPLGEDLVSRYDFLLVALMGHKDVEEFLLPDGGTDQAVVTHSVHDESPFSYRTTPQPLCRNPECP